MYKKIVLTTIMILLSIILISCDKQEVKIYNMYSQIYFNKDVFKESYTGIVTAYAEWKKRSFTDDYQFLLKKYNENYFENHALAVYNFSQTQEMSNIKVMEVTKSKKTLNIYFDYNQRDEYQKGVVLVELLKKDINGIEKIVGHYNKYEYVSISLAEPPSGCLVMIYLDYVRVGTTYDLAYAKKYFNTPSFIDFDTLTVYNDEIIVNENIELLTYRNGVEDSYIRGYVLKNGNFKYNIDLYSLLDFENYEVLKNGDILVESDDVTYIFSKSNQEEDKLYLSSIQSPRGLFTCSKEEMEEKLSILYGSSDYTSNAISIDLHEDGFTITLAEVCKYLFG